MTDKRFTITQKEDYFYVRDEVNKKPMGMFEFKQDEFPVYFCFHKIIDLLNEQHETIQVLEKYLDNMRCGALTDDKRIKELYEENEQLKQRNNRQAKQLDRLYNLIEQKDWRTLNDILDDFKRCEEQLQREWGTYE